VKVSFVSLLAAAAVTAALSEPGYADEVRDHRAAAAGGSVEVRDHRADSASVEVRSRYRRRPGPRFMMPLKIDLGAAGADTVRGYAPGIGMAIGIHWASLSPTPTDGDIGIGVFGAALDAPRGTAAMSDANGVGYAGAYLELAHTLSRGDWWRTWASGRGEYLASSAFDQDHTGFGASGRLSAELYVSGVGVEPRGVFLGTYAIGVYAEAGVRDVGPDVSKFHVGGGLTFRTPLVFMP